MSKISWNKIVEMAHSQLEKPIVNDSKQHINARCPFCGDSRTKPYARRLYIDYYSSYDTYTVKCFRCGEACNVISLYAYLNNVPYSQAKREIENRVYDPADIKKRLFKKRQELTKEKEYTFKVLDLDLSECFSQKDKPKGRQDARLVHYLQKFMEERQIPVDCYVAHSGPYRNRFIIPIFLNGEIVYFQGRAIFDEQEPKYLNPAVEKEDIIMHSDKFDRNKNIIVTEGPIDAYMVGYQGTAPLGGLYIDDEYIRKLKKFTDKDIIIVFDNINIDKASKKIVDSLKKKSKYYKELLYFVMPNEFKEYKDLNDLVKDNLVKRENIYDFVCFNAFSFEYLRTRYL